MNNAQEMNVIAAALAPRHEARKLETARDYVLAVFVAGGEHCIANTDTVVVVLTNQLGATPTLWQEYDRVKHTLGTLYEYIRNAGVAGSNGNYWTLTEAGQLLLESTFEYQLLAGLQE